MKKNVCLMVVLILGLIMNSVVFATPKVVIDDKIVEFDVDPIIENGRTMVPFRKIFEALGLSVEWNASSQMAVAYNDTTYVAIHLNDNYGSINGRLYALDAQATIIDGRVLVPLRFISEAFGNEIKWDSKNETASITSGFKKIDQTESLPIVGSHEKLESLLVYNNRFENVYYTDRVFVEEDMTLGIAEEKAEAPSMEAEANADYSETNVQVQGVDEADIVKTDGAYIYYVRNNDVIVTKADGHDLTKVSTIQLDKSFNPSEIYLKDNKLVLIGKEAFPPYHIMREDEGLVQEEMIWPYSQSSSKVVIYDLADKHAPKVIRELFLEGDYLTSRMIGNHFYLVANRYLNQYYEKGDSLLPHYEDSLEQDVKSVDYSEIRYFPDATSNNYLILAGLNLDALNEKADIQTFLGSGNNVYMSKEHLLVALSQYRYRDRGIKGVNDYEKQTSIYQFAVSEGKFNYHATGKIPGHLLNQFSMDADEGYFRVATTTGEMWRSNENISKNNVYVLDSNMNQVGALEGIAPGEQIYSIRFMGDRAYMVTFRQVDPFFVIDLSNVYKPYVLGYLKIPGFSDYLHPYDENTIIGFGKETVETKSGVRTEGFKMALFDVTDVQNPVEKHRVVIGDSGTYSELLNNHKALMFAKERHTLAFPITIRQKDQSGMTRFSFQGAQVYTVTPEDGFQLRGSSTHLSSTDYKTAGDYWYQNDKNINRILYIGDVLYTLSNQGIKSHDFETMEEYTHVIYE